MKKEKEAPLPSPADSGRYFARRYFYKYKNKDIFHLFQVFRYMTNKKVNGEIAAPVNDFSHDR